MSTRMAPTGGNLWRSYMAGENTYNISLGRDELWRGWASTTTRPKVRETHEVMSGSHEDTSDLRG